MKRSAVLVNLIFIAFTTYVVLASLSWRWNAKLFPLAVGIPLLLICVVQLRRDLRQVSGAVSAKGGQGAAIAGPVASPAGPAAPPPVTVDPAGDAQPRESLLGPLLLMGRWFMLFLATVWVVGFPNGIPLFLLSYLRLQGKESWRLALSVSAGAWTLITFGLVRFMQLSFPEPLLSRWWYVFMTG